jgi:hypothetical protein
MNKMIFVAGAAMLSASAAQAVVSNIPFTVSLESEAPGIQSSRAGFHAVGVETFENVGTGNGLNFVTNFGGSAFSGTYSGVQVIGADQYGGAGGTGRYAVTFSDTGYSVDLTTALAGGVTYFGFWLSALDGGNTVSFYSGGNLLFNFSATDARNFINGLPSSSSYYGNPNSQFAGQNTGEPYAFLNFYARGGTTFDRIVFAENPMQGGYESDNHTVGQWKRISGTIIPVPGTQTAVPEPASWLMMISGFGLVGAGMRRRRVLVAAA